MRLADAIGAAGALIINADDWGRDRENTGRILNCFLRGTVSSVSAMVFMEDSERAAALSREHGIDSGLHLNLTSPLTAKDTPMPLRAHQRLVVEHLRRHKLSQIVYHPGLARSFEYVVKAQLEEYERIFGARPARIDGHHHMHLCANVLWGKLLPKGTIVRRSFSFAFGEKSFFNVAYRRFVDRTLAKRHHLADYLFSIAPLAPSDRLRRVFALAARAYVEVETHPVHQSEYEFLLNGTIHGLTDGVRIARSYLVGCQICVESLSVMRG